MTGPAAQRLAEYLERHAANDLEGVMALFARDAQLEDPVGAAPLCGSEAIRAFFRATHARNGRLALERVGPMLEGGDEVAAHVRARLLRVAGTDAVDVIYTLRVDRDGHIALLRAHF